MSKKYGKLVIVICKLSAKHCAYWRKFGGYLADIWRIYLKELTAKYGGYCRKLGKNMVDIDGYLADILEGI